MDPTGWLILSLVLAVEAAIIISLVAGFFWWRYRKTSTSLLSLAAEKEHLVQQRDAYLKFLDQHLREFGTGRHRGQKEDPQQALARRILETEKRHTLAARDRHLDIWDLRKESTRGLIDLLQGAPENAIPESPQAGLAKTASEGELRRQLADREKTIERQREQIALLHPLRDAWTRLHGRARRESAANAAFRDQVNAIIQDPDERLALETALEAYSPIRDALDDYLQVTAAAYEDAEPQQRRLAQRRQRRLSRMQTVINRSAARITDAVGGMPALLKDHRNVITQLETKLKQVRDAREIQKLNYEREVRRLRSINKSAEDNLRLMERENHRLQQRLRNVMQMAREQNSPFVPDQPAPTGAASGGAPEQKEALVKQLSESLRQEREKNSRLESRLEKAKEIQQALETMLRQ